MYDLTNGIDKDFILHDNKVKEAINIIGRL